MHGAPRDGPLHGYLGDRVGIAQRLELIDLVCGGAGDSVEFFLCSGLKRPPGGGPVAGVLPSAGVNDEGRTHAVRTFGMRPRRVQGRRA